MQKENSEVPFHPNLPSFLSDTLKAISPETTPSLDWPDKINGLGLTKIELPQQSIIYHLLPTQIMY